MGLMNKTLVALTVAATALTTAVYANEEKITQGFYSYDAMGCMLLKECTNGVDKIYSSGDLKTQYPNENWDAVEQEFNEIMVAFRGECFP